MIIILIVVAVILAAVLQILLIRRGARGISAEVNTDKAGTEPGEVFTVTLRLRNESYLIRPFVGFELVFPKQVNVISDMETVDSPPYSVRVKGSVFLWPKGSAERSIRASFDERGNYRFGSITIKTGDFLGLKEETAEIGFLQSVSVYPERLEGADIRKVTGGIMGDMPVRRFIFEDPVLFSGFREYTGREPMKDISWLQSARCGQLMVRQYDHTSHMTATVILDTFGAEPEEVEICFSLARDVCSQLGDAGIEYGLCMNADLGGAAVGGNYVSQGMGERHLHGILMQLANALYSCRYTDVTLLQGVVRNLRQTTGIIFITADGTQKSRVLQENLPAELLDNICIVSARDHMDELTEEKKWA